MTAPVGGAMNAEHKRPGRPRLDDKRRKRVAMNDAEWAQVQAQARVAGVTAAAWVRARCGL